MAPLPVTAGLRRPHLPRCGAFVALVLVLASGIQHLVAGSGAWPVGDADRIVE